MARFHKVFIVCNGTTPYLETIGLTKKECVAAYNEIHDTDLLEKGELQLREATLELKDAVAL